MIRPENFNNLEEKLNYQLHNIKLFKLINSFLYSIMVLNICFLK